jgi:hypothetical protein
MKILLAAALALAAGFASPAPGQAVPAAASPVSSAPDLEKTLLVSANGLANAYIQMDQGLFLSLIAPDFLFVSKWGVLDPEALSSQVQACVMSSFEIKSPRAHLLSPDSAVLVFKAHQALACNGKAEPSDLIVTEVYERKGDKWLMSTHMQTEAL